MMQLIDFKETWNELSRTVKLGIIESSNERRLEAFEISKQKKTRSSSTRKKSRSKTKATPENFIKLMEKMSPEERDNMKMLLAMDKD